MCSSDLVAGRAGSTLDTAKKDFPTGIGLFTMVAVDTKVFGIIKGTTLETDLRDEMIGLLKEYSYCFAWNYTEMPGLSQEIVEHRLPIKSGFRPFK